MIPFARPYLPPRKRLDRYLDRIFESAWLTNDGPLVRELTTRLEQYLGVENLLLVANGTLALQIAFATLEIKGQAVTTPFTFPATSSALLWQGVGPRYAAIDPKTLNLNPHSVERSITESTSGLVPVHTYGNPCKVEAFSALAQRTGLKVIYDGAHAFGVRYKGESILRWGDASTLSLHATKLFHCGEGGAIVFRRYEDLVRAKRLINFGLSDGVPTEIGINAKLSELHAAMGLAVLEDVDDIIQRRVEIVLRYTRLLANHTELPFRSESSTLNGAYMPVLFSSLKERETVRLKLLQNEILARPYFSTSLDQLPIYSNTLKFDRVAEDAAERVLCLPLFYGLEDSEIDRIAKLTISAVGSHTS